MTSFNQPVYRSSHGKIICIQMHKHSRLLLVVMVFCSTLRCNRRRHSVRAISFPQVIYCNYIKWALWQTASADVGVGHCSLPRQRDHTAKWLCSKSGRWRRGGNFGKCSFNTAAVKAIFLFRFFNVFIKSFYFLICFCCRTAGKRGSRNWLNTAAKVKVLK